MTLKLTSITGGPDDLRPIYECLDFRSPQIVQISFSADKRTLWVNIDERCVLRVQAMDPETLSIVGAPRARKAGG